MVGHKPTASWPNIVEYPLAGRNQKPRQRGQTMVMDKGLGVARTKDLLNFAGDYIDFLKLGFGTSALYKPDQLEQKINLATNHSVHVYPGGTFMEIAVMQGRLKEFISTAKEIGFTALEVSDGTIEMSAETRRKVIFEAANSGLVVLCEVGKKYPQGDFQASEYLKQIKQDLADGAYRVIVEGRETGKNAGFYDGEGKFISGIEDIISELPDPGLLIWEAPLKDQQQYLITRFGPNVNLGNINPDEALALEALRVGLRGDTLRLACQL